MPQTILIQHFRDKHQEMIGHPYMVQWGKDNTIMKELARVYTVTKVLLLTDAFFETMKKDKFLQQTGASIGILKTQVPKLLMSLKEGINKNTDKGTW